MTDQSFENIDKLSDKELADILYFTKNNYSLEETAAAEREFYKRGLELIDYYTEVEIAEIERLKKIKEEEEAERSQILAEKIQEIQDENRDKSLMIGIVLLAFGACIYLFTKQKSFGLLSIGFAAFSWIDKGLKK